MHQAELLPNHYTILGALLLAHPPTTKSIAYWPVQILIEQAVWGEYPRAV